MIRNEVGGDLKYFGLVDWWLSTFSEEEQDYIIRTFSGGGVGGVTAGFAEGPTTYTSLTAPGLLVALAGYFSRTTSDLHIARRILEKAEDLALGPDRHPGQNFCAENKIAIEYLPNIVALDMIYRQMIRTYYRFRGEDPKALDLTIDACKRHIKAMPHIRAEYLRRGEPPGGNFGYSQLSIILERQGKFEEAISLNREALAMGLPDVWEKRIKRCENAMKRRGISIASDIGENQTRQ